MLPAGLSAHARPDRDVRFYVGWHLRPALAPAAGGNDPDLEVLDQKLKPFIVSLDQEDLLVLKEMVEAGEIAPSIDRRDALRDAADVLRHVGEGRAQGQTVIHV